jgi:hypothetical protein
MGRPKRSLTSKRAIATRIQRLIDRHYENFNRFKEDMVRKGRPKLAATAQGWVPPQERWRKDPKRGKGMQRVDWEVLKTPDYDALRPFCDAFGVTADYIYYGKLPKYRRQARSDASLERDLATAVGREIRQHLEGGILGNELFRAARRDRPLIKERLSSWERPNGKRLLSALVRYVEADMRRDIAIMRRQLDAAHLVYRIRAAFDEVKAEGNSITAAGREQLKDAVLALGKLQPVIVQLASEAGRFAADYEEIDEVTTRTRREWLL